MKSTWTEEEQQTLRTAIVNANREIYDVENYSEWLIELDNLRRNTSIYQDMVATLEEHVTHLEKRIEDLHNVFRLAEDDQVRIEIRVTHGLAGRRAGVALSGETFRQFNHDVALEALKRGIHNTAELIYKEAAEKVVPKR